MQFMPPDNKNVTRLHPPMSSRAGPSGTPRTQIETDPPPPYTPYDTKHIFNPTARSQNPLTNAGASMLASDHEHASGLQRAQFEREQRKPEEVRAMLASDHEYALELQRAFEREQRKPEEVRAMFASDHEYALELQRAFEREQRNAEEMRARLVVEYPEQKVFECGICLDTYLIDFAAPVEGCEHALCRDCLRRHVVSRLDEGRYHIVCPMCSEDKIGQGPGFVTPHGAELLGLSQDQYETWTLLGLRQYSVLFDCPHCHSRSLVDRDDYFMSSVIRCPLPACNGACCKECSQVLDLTNGPHSCDGQAKMDRSIPQGPHVR